MTSESSPLLENKKELSSRNDIKPVPFMRCAITCGVITFLVFLTNISASPIISQYVHAKLLNDTDNTTREGASSCRVNSSSTDDENDPLIRAQEQTSNFLLLLAITNNVPAVFVNIVLGSLSDYLGRKILFLLPAIGYLLKNIFCVFIMYFKMDIQYFYLAYAIEGFGGSGCAYLAASFSYTADISSGGNRIVATTIMELCLGLAACTGMLLTGFLIPAIGYLYLQIVMASVALVSVLLVFVLPETRLRGEHSPWSFATHFKNVFGFYVRKGKNENKRELYILTIAIFLFGVVSVLGRIPIETLYGLGQPFCFDSVEVGYFGALRIGLSNVGALVAIKLFQHHIRDETIALIGAIDSVISCVFEGLAITAVMLYLVPVVGFVSSTTVPIIRGAMSRMTSPEEQGAMFAGIGFVETVMNLICQVLYTSVYSATVKFARGTVFFVMAGFSGVAAILVIIWMRITPRYKNMYTIYVSKDEEVVTASITDSKDGVKLSAQM